MENKEIWKDIPEYEGYYQVSNMGNVRSLDRTVVYKDGRECFYKSRSLGDSVNKKGYRQVCLGINGTRKTFGVSQLVAMTFLNHTPDGHTLVVDHINGDITDDRVENLQIVSNRENSSTCFRSDRDLLTSKYIGVRRHSQSSKWQAEIGYNYKSVYIGLYSSELEASEAYQSALAKINDGTFNVNDYKAKFTSKYKGVSFHKTKDRWFSYLTIDGRRKHVGYFDTELEAYTALQEFKKNNIQQDINF